MSIIAGLSFDFNDTAESACDVLNVPQDRYNIVTTAKRYMQQSNYTYSGAKEFGMTVGYYVEHDQLSCRLHWEHYEQIDFLIVNVVFNRPKTFIESYGIFNNYMKQVETSLISLKAIANPTFEKVYYRVTLERTNGGRNMWMDSSNRNMIDHKKFNNFIHKISKRYQKLFLDYAFQWSSNKNGNMRTIILNQLTNVNMETSILPVQPFNETMAVSKIIPMIKGLPEYMDTLNNNSAVLFHKSLDTFFNAISSSGFSSVHFKPGINKFKILI